MGLAGPPLPTLDRSGLRRTSTASSPLPALDRSGPPRASTGESLSAVGLAGLTPRDSEHCGSRRASTAGKNVSKNATQNVKYNMR